MDSYKKPENGAAAPIATLQRRQRVDSFVFIFGKSTVTESSTQKSCTPRNQQMIQLQKKVKHVLSFFLIFGLC